MIILFYKYLFYWPAAFFNKRLSPALLRLSTYLQSTGKTYKDHKATILSWFYKDQGSKKKFNIPTWEEYNKGVHL